MGFKSKSTNAWWSKWEKKHLCHSCTGSRLCSPHHPGNSLVMRFAKKTAVDSPLQVTPLFCPFNLSHLQQNQPLASENLASISWDYNHLFQATQFVILCSSSSCWLTEYQEWEVCMLKGESQRAVIWFGLNVLLGEFVEAGM